MTAIRIIDDHVQLASIGSKTHAAIEGHIQGIGNYAFPAADGGADQVLKTNGAGVLAWIDKNHSIASHNDTTATGAQLDTLVDNSIADALHRHSELVASDGSPDPALSCDATGQVGIGVTPQRPLHVKHSSIDMLARFESSDAKSGIELKDLTATCGIFQTAGVIHLDENNDGVGTLVIKAGNVGIGTINPQKPLHIVSTTQPQIRIEYGANDIAEFGRGTDKFWIKVTDAAGAIQQRMTIDELGHIGFGTTSPATSALLELLSTTGALLLTRMTTAQRNALTAVNGMLIYNSTLNKFQGREGGAWTSLI